MNYYDFDEWYYQELDRAMRTAGRGRTRRLSSRITRSGVYRMCTGLYASLRGGSGRTFWFAGAKRRALHRTRTGDPFLTIQRGPHSLMRLIALVLGLFWLCAGLGILWLFGGLS